MTRAGKEFPIRGAPRLVSGSSARRAGLRRTPDVRRRMPRSLLVPLALTLVLPLTAAGEKPAPEETAAVAKGNNAFAFDLYGQLRTQDGNLLEWVHIVHRNESPRLEKIYLL